jgi:hypothetical protein
MLDRGAAAIIMLLLSLGYASAATINAASCEHDDVQAAIDDALDGDTVMIPAGTCTWTTTVDVGTQTGWNPPVYDTKAITIQGAGVGRTIIIDNNPVDSSGNGGGLISIATKQGGFSRLTGLTLDSTVHQDLDPNTYNRAMVGISGFGRTWRIDHVHFKVGSGHGITTWDSTYGVIDHNVFDLYGWHFGMYVHHPYWNNVAHGDGSWADDLYPGTEKAVYVEDNIFNAPSGMSTAIDGWSGGRVVFRYNILNNATPGQHGTDSPGRDRSMRSMELYRNTITIDNPDYYYLIMQLRGGTFIIFDNILKNRHPESFMLENYRSFDEFSPWGKCDGTSPFDLNDDKTYDIGAHTGASGSRVLTASGKTWTVDQWKGYYLHNTAKGTSGLIESNTANTITTGELTHHTPLITFDNGDSFKILNVIACLDQRGRGKGDLISGDEQPWGSGVVPQAWPNQAIEPTYGWNNTLNGMPTRLITQDEFRMKEGRDFFNSPMPGYAPYTYPHPLTLSDSTGCGNSICDSGETCSTCSQDCKKGPADNNPCDNCINTPELNSYISLWLSGSVQIENMMDSIKFWKMGCL